MPGTKEWIDGKDEGIEEATERAAQACDERAGHLLNHQDNWPEDWSGRNEHQKIAHELRKLAAYIRGRA